MEIEIYCSKCSGLTGWDDISWTNDVSKLTKTKHEVLEPPPGERTSSNVRCLVCGHEDIALYGVVNVDSVTYRPDDTFQIKRES